MAPLFYPTVRPEALGAIRGRMVLSRGLRDHDGAASGNK
jgi:hypothetical protein